MSNTDINAIFAPAPDRVKSMEKELEAYRAICKEFLDGSEETTNPESLRAYIDEKTDELQSVKEEFEEYQEDQESGNKLAKKICEKILKEKAELQKELAIKTDMAETLQKEVDIEHTRYLQEAIKRGDIQETIRMVRMELYGKDKYGEDIGWKDIANIVDYHTHEKEIGEEWEKFYSEEAKENAPLYSVSELKDKIEKDTGLKLDNEFKVVWEDGTADIDKEAKEAYKEDIEKEIVFDHFRFEKADIDNDTDLFNAYKEAGHLNAMIGHRKMTSCFDWTNFDKWIDSDEANLDEDDWWKPFYNSFEEAIVSEYGDQSIQAKRYGFGVFKPKVTLPTPLIPYPRQNIIGKYPDFAESVEKEVEITKEYFKNNCECSKEAVKEFANTHNHSNEMVDYIKNLPDDKFDRAYWGYTQLFKTAGDKEKVKIVGNILNTEGGIELMRASFYLMCWDTKKAGILIDSYRRLVEHYWDGVGTWIA